MSEQASGGEHEKGEKGGEDATVGFLPVMAMQIGASGPSALLPLRQMRELLRKEVVDEVAGGGETIEEWRRQMLVHLDAVEEKVKVVGVPAEDVGGEEGGKGDDEVVETGSSQLLRGPVKIPVVRWVVPQGSETNETSEDAVRSTALGGVAGGRQDVERKGVGDGEFLVHTDSTILLADPPKDDDDQDDGGDGGHDEVERRGESDHKPTSSPGPQLPPHVGAYSTTQSTTSWTFSPLDSTPTTPPVSTLNSFPAFLFPSSPSSTTPPQRINVLLPSLPGAWVGGKSGEGEGEKKEGGVEGMGGEEEGKEGGRKEGKRRKKSPQKKSTTDALLSPVRLSTTTAGASASTSVGSGGVGKRSSGRGGGSGGGEGGGGGGVGKRRIASPSASSATIGTRSAASSTSAAGRPAEELMKGWETVSGNKYTPKLHVLPDEKRDRILARITAAAHRATTKPSPHKPPSSPPSSPGLSATAKVDSLRKGLGVSKKGKLHSPLLAGVRRRPRAPNPHDTTSSVRKAMAKARAMGSKAAESVEDDDEVEQWVLESRDGGLEKGAEEDAVIVTGIGSSAGAGAKVSVFAALEALRNDGQGTVSELDRLIHQHRESYRPGTWRAEEERRKSTTAIKPSPTTTPPPPKPPPSTSSITPAPTLHQPPPPLSPPPQDQPRRETIVVGEEEKSGGVEVEVKEVVTVVEEEGEESGDESPIPLPEE